MSVSGEKMRYSGKKAKCQKKYYAKWNPRSGQCQCPRSHWLQQDEDFTQALRGAAWNYQDNSEQAETERSALGCSNPASSCQLRAFSNGHDGCHNLLVIVYLVSSVIIYKSVYWHVKKNICLAWHWNRHQKLLICESFFFFFSERTCLTDNMNSMESEILGLEGIITTF